MTDLVGSPPSVYISFMSSQRRHVHSLDKPQPGGSDRGPVDPLLASALEALPKGLTAHADRPAVVAIGRNGTEYLFRPVLRRVVRPSTLSVAVDEAQARESDHEPLLISTHISAECAELLRERGVQFADAAGNVYLDTPDFFVFVTGRRPAEPLARRSPDQIGSAALQVAFTLLRDPEAQTWPVRTLGAAAGVSHSAAATALRTFEHRCWIRTTGRTQRSIVDPVGFLNAWVSGFADRLGPSLEIARATSPGTNWTEGIVDQLSPEIGVLGGESAATLSGYPIVGETTSVYVHEWNAETMKRLRLVPALNGTVVVRSAFAPHLEDPRDPRLADPLLVLGEVSTVPDERLDETRAALRADVLARMSK